MSIEKDILHVVCSSNEVINELASKNQRRVDAVTLKKRVGGQPVEIV